MQSDGGDDADSGETTTVGAAGVAASADVLILSGRRAGEFDDDCVHCISIVAVIVVRKLRILIVRGAALSLSVLRCWEARVRPSVLRQRNK